MLSHIRLAIVASIIGWSGISPSDLLHSAEPCPPHPSGAPERTATLQQARMPSDLFPGCNLRRTASRSTATAQIVPPRPQSPHWDHIAMSDFARGYYWSAEPTKDADREWLAARVDLIEGNSATDAYIQAMRQWNPTLGVFRYRLDHYDFVNDQSRDYPESHVLHVTNATKMALKSRDVGEQSLTFAAGDRLQFLVWNNRY